MKPFTLVQLGFVVVAGGLVGWEYLHARALRSQALAVQVQLEVQQQELAAREQSLASLEKQNAELQEAERRAGNQRLLSLMRERNAVALGASQATTEAAAKAHAFGPALAKTLENPEQRQAKEDSRRAEMRVGLYQFFKLVNLPPEQCEAYIDLGIQKERRQAERLAALLQGQMTAAEALTQQASDEQVNERRSREILGEDGQRFLDGIADGMRNTEAKRLLGIIQDNLGDDRLNADQGERLQGLIKSEIVSIPMDDVDLFRPPEEWTQDVLARQQRLAAEATEFLTPAQLDKLKTIGTYDLAERQKQMAARRTALGMK